MAARDEPRHQWLEGSAKRQHTRRAHRCLTRWVGVRSPSTRLGTPAATADSCAGYCRRLLVERAEAVSRTIADRRTTFVVVSTLEDAPVREAEFFMQALVERELHLGALVLNKVLPPWFADEGAAVVGLPLVIDRIGA